MPLFCLHFCMPSLCYLGCLQTFHYPLPTSRYILDIMKRIAHKFYISVFPIPIAPRIKIHSFSECTSPRFEARQSISERRLWFKDCRFWFSSDILRGWPYDWICGNKMVQITRTASECESIQCSCGHLVCWLHPHGTIQQRTPFSWQRFCSPVQLNHRGQ